MMTNKMKIVITHDPDFSNIQEDEVNAINSYHNLVTASIASALNQAGHYVVIFETTLELERHLKNIKPDLVFNTSIKNFNGSEYAFAPEIVEKLEIPFTGPSAIACSNAYDKQKAVDILRKAGIHTPQAVSFSPGDDIKLLDTMSFPLFVKPRQGGCSQGISSQSIIRTKVEALDKIHAVLEETREPVIVQEFLSGREFTVGILGNQPPKILSVLEFIFQDTELPFRSYSRKMVNYETEDEVFLAKLETADRLAIENLTVNAFNALGCRDYARIDVRMDVFGNPAVLEVNAIPNLEPKTSSFALMAMQAGISFNGLIERIVKSALKRFAPID